MPTLSVWVECLHGHLYSMQTMSVCVQPPLQHIVTRMPYMQEVWPKMYPPKACTALCKAVQHQHKLLVQQYQDGLAVLPLIEAQLVCAAYRGPDASVIPPLILPLLKQRLESTAAEVSAYLVSVLLSAMIRPRLSHTTPLQLRTLFCCRALDTCRCTMSA